MSCTRGAQIAREFAQHSRFVKRSLRRLGVGSSDADDALQQVFLVVHRRFDEYAELSSKRGWLFCVSELVTWNYQRGLRRAHARLSRLTTVPELDLEEVVCRREAGRIVSKCLERLKESERVTFYLADIEGLTATEIALELDVKVNTVYSRLRAARRRVKTALARRQLTTAQ